MQAMSPSRDRDTRFALLLKGHKGPKGPKGPKGRATIVLLCPFGPFIAINRTFH